MVLGCLLVPEPAESAEASGGEFSGEDLAGGKRTALTIKLWGEDPRRKPEKRYKTNEESHRKRVIATEKKRMHRVEEMMRTGTNPSGKQPEIDGNSMRAAKSTAVALY
ncbi:hypothetical protein AVEN_242116-1 [Araneus ventricosus]|uniref:IBB domain-containing protein n=1 Tax=Araneus ventricosus TaxID=182803 RepID=A0A4Y2SF54_ARAVE|nr:hypothetical protein AVEN_242116-1 [Araneus ventricosus]